MILTQEAIEFISSKLKLPFTGVEQDWEVELADSKRIGEFISFYKRTALSLDEKRALMSLIFASYDELLNSNGIDRDKLWNEITSLIRFEKEFFGELLDYWGLKGETDPENYFKLTPLVRSIA
jgi:hypothetical protein